MTASSHGITRFSAGPDTENLASRLPTPLAWATPYIDLLEQHGVQCLLLREYGHSGTALEPHSADLFIQKRDQRAYIELGSTSLYRANSLSGDGVATSDIAAKVFHPLINDLLDLTHYENQLATLMQEANVSRTLAKQALGSHYPWVPYVLRTIMGTDRDFCLTALETTNHGGTPSVRLTVDHTDYLRFANRAPRDPHPVTYTVSPDMDANVDPQDAHILFDELKKPIADCRQTLAVAQEDNIIWRAPWALDTLHELLVSGADIKQLNFVKKSKKRGLSSVSCVIEWTPAGAKKAYKIGLNLYRHDDPTLFSVETSPERRQTAKENAAELRGLANLCTHANASREMPRSVYPRHFKDRRFSGPDQPSLRPR